MIRRFRPRSQEIEAVQWDGENEAELVEFAGRYFYTLDPEGRANCGDPEATATVFDNGRGDWLLVHVGQWITRDADGDLRRCSDDDLADDYEEVIA